MNKIYKLIWSKVKNMWVVASELAKSHTKAPSSRNVSRTVVSGVLACVLSCGAVVLVYAAGTDSYEAGGGSASGDYSVAIGKSTIANDIHTNVIGYDSSAEGDFTSVFGSYSHIFGEYSFLIGNNSSIANNIKNANVFGNEVLVNNGTHDFVGTGVGEGVVAIGNNIIVSLNEKAENSRSSTSSSDPAIKHVVALGDNVVIGEENAVGIGHTATAIALNALAIGDDAQAVAEGANAIGHSSQATNRFANASGYQAQATGEGAGAFGQDAQATANFATAFGRSTRASAESATAIGNTAHAVTQSSIAIGSSAVANGGANTNAVAIGRGAAVGSDTQGYGEAVALGGGSSVQNAYGTALGSGASVTGQNSVALGYGSTAVQSNVVSVGKDAVTGDTPVAEMTRRIVHVADGVNNTDAVNVKQLNDAKTKYFGVNAVWKAWADLTDDEKTALGVTTEAEYDVIVAGSNRNGEGAIGNNSIAIGKNATSGYIDSIYNSVTGSDTIAIGTNAYSKFDNSISVGKDATALGYTDIAIGRQSSAAGGNSVAIGDGTKTTEFAGVAIGYKTEAGYDAIAIGDQAKTTMPEGIAIGMHSTAGSTSVSIGKYAVADTGSLSVAVGPYAEAQGDTSVAVGYLAKTSKDSSGSSTAVGTHAEATGSYASAFGPYAKATANQSLALSEYSEASGSFSSAVGYSAKATGESALAIGHNSEATANKTVVVGGSAVADKSQNTAVGFASSAKGDYSMAFGSSSSATGNYSSALGYLASVQKQYGTALGTYASVGGEYSTALGASSATNADDTTTVGYGSGARAKGATALGKYAGANAEDSLALGRESTVSGKNSVALGVSSFATEENVVSLGKDAVGTVGEDGYVPEYTRRIQHVTAGVNDTDAVNVSQLNDGLYDKANWDASNIGRNLSMADDEYPEGLTDEQKAEVLANNREYNLRSWGQALGAGTVTGGDSRLVTGDTLHVEVRPAENGTYVKTNNTTGQNLLLLDQQLSTVLDGTASQNTAISDLQNEMDAKANVGLDNITDAGKTVVRDLAKESVKVVNGTNTTVTEGTDGNAKTYAVNAVTDGAVADGNTGIVTGGTVYSAIQDMIASSGSSEGKANVALDNVTEAGHTVIKTDAKSAVNVAGNSDVTVTKTDVDGVDTYNVAVVKTGTVSDGNEGIVTGDTVYDALRAETRPSADGNYITSGNTAGANLTALDTQVKTNADAIASVTDGMDGKANTSLDNVTSAGQDVIRTLAKGSVKVADGMHTTVTEGTDGDAKTYVVNVSADGLIADGDTGIVTGGAVYNALQTQASDTVTALDTKANKDASNVTDAEAWGTKIATGSVAENDVKAVSGDTVYRMKTVLESAVSDGLDGKANVGLDNISIAGEGVVKDLAKGSVNVVGGVYATVDKSDVNGVDTYTVNVDTSGAVTDGDTKLVTGGVVYNALQTQASDMATALDTKANKDASNVTDAEAWGTKIATGSVAENDVRAISGDTAYRMKTALETAMNTGLDSKADNDLSNLTDAGQAVIQQKAISSVKVGDGDNTTVSSETDADGNIIYKVKANATGTVAANDTGLVDGGTVYEALENTKSEMTGNISGKADKDLGNITDDGKEVVKDLAKDSVSVESGTNAEVVKTDVNGVDTYTVNVAGNGQVSENDTGLVNGGTMYNELRPVDGNYVRKDVTTAANLSALDTKIGSVSDGTFVRSANTVGQNLNALDEALYDKANKDASNIGRNLSIADHEYPDGLTAEQKAEYASNQREYNLCSWGQALGAGTVTGGDARLITGDTLHVEVRPANSGTYVRVDKTTGENLLALDEQLSSVVNGSSAQSTAISDLENEMANKANIALDNINADGVNVVRNIAKSAVVVADGPNTTVSSSTDTDGNITYHVTANATGSVADGNTGLVDGGMVYTAIENAKGSMGGDIGGLDADGNYIRKANTVAQNLVALDTQVKTNADGLAAEQTVRETADTALSNRIGTLTADGNYIAKDSSVSENLSRLDTAVKTAGDTADANAAAIADLKDLSNITAAGETVIKDLAKGSVKVINGTNTTVTEGMDGDVKTFAVNVASNGAVADGDTGLVSGGTVKSALDALSGSVDAGLAGKANVSLDNLDADGHTVIKSDAKSAVNVVGSNRAAVTKTDVNGVDTYTVDVKADGVILADNKGLVDGGTVFDAVVAATGNIIDYTNDGFAGKANVELDNLAATGHAVIKSDAKSAVNVTGGQYATVTKTDVDGVDTYMVNVATDGSVADGNDKLVTGGTVYDALQDIRGSVDTAMAGKANTSLDNLDVAGVGRVRDIAKTAVSVANGAHTTASSETDADGNVTYRVNVDLDGSVASGNNGVVSGGGIYHELRPADGNYVAQSNTTAANLTALDVAVKEAMMKAETAQAAAGGNVVLYDGDDKSAVTLGGTDGTVIHNVADGAVSADSKDAVNGGQLYTVKSSVDANTTAIAGLDTKIQDHATAIAGLDTRVQDNATAIAGLDTRVQDNATAIAGLDTRVQDNATAIDTLRTTVTDGLNGKADTDLGNLSDTGKETVRGLAKESVRVADGLNTTVRTTVDGNASVYHVDVATTGRVESGNAGIVTGDAVYEALRDLELNASDTHYVSVNPSERDDETYTNHGASGSDAVAIGAKSYARGDVSVAIGHNNDVSGNETYVIGSDVNATGNHSVVLGKGSDGSLDNVVSVGSAGNERRIVHVADGELSADSKDAVNGKQLYEVREKLQNAEGIDVDKWSDALGTGSVAPDDDWLVKGSTVYSAIQSFSGITLSPDGSTLHVGTNNTATVVDFSNSEGNGRILQGVVTDPDNPNSAANVGYVNAVGQNIIHGVNNSLNRMDTKIDKVGAGAAALASLEPMPFDDDQKWSISAAIGTYHGTQAGAVGVFYKPQDNVMLNIRGAVGNGENMGGAGLSIGLNKGAAKGLSKASMAKAMNAQANEIVAQKQLIQNQQAQLDAQKAEIEELKQMVRSVVASKQAAK